MNPGGIAVDAMGGDQSPREIVYGAVDFAAETGREAIVVGDETAIRALVAGIGAEELPLRIVPASEVIASGEPIRSIRSKRDSSMHVGYRLLRDGGAAALVSAGHTGAFMALGKVIVGALDGVDRPALPAPLPRLEGGYTILIDAGANLDCSPEHFRQFAVMGFHYARRVFGVDSPKVGLLSIGEEDSKGSVVLRDVSSILRETRVNFIGNVEGNQLFSPRADVVLCDGFIGNVTLKVAEGIAETIIQELRIGIKSGPLRRLGALPLRPVFRLLRKKIDYAEYGGVPLLGLKSVAIVAHGRSTAKAIRNAMHVAATAADSDMTARIAREISVLHETEDRLAAAGGGDAE